MRWRSPFIRYWTSRNATHLLWNGRNIAQRVKAEAGRRESEERYALVTEAIHEGVAGASPVVAGGFGMTAGGLGRALNTPQGSFRRLQGSGQRNSGWRAWVEDLIVSVVRFGGNLARIFGLVWLIGFLPSSNAARSCGREPSAGPR